MAMKRYLLLLAAGLLGGGIAVQAQDFEDIYYNPKKDVKDGFANLKGEEA